jgi:hypothetical protein
LGSLKRSFGGLKLSHELAILSWLLELGLSRLKRVGLLLEWIMLGLLLRWNRCLLSLLGKLEHQFWLILYEWIVSLYRSLVHLWYDFL